MNIFAKLFFLLSFCLSTTCGQLDPADKPIAQPTVPVTPPTVSVPPPAVPVPPPAVPVPPPAVPLPPPAVPFVFIWNVGTTPVNLPLPANYNYNFTVQWGDGTHSQVSSYRDTDHSHQYATPGEYTVIISGLVESWDSLGPALIKVINLGDVGWKNLKYAFARCSNLISFAGGVTNKVTDMSSMFFEADSLTSLDVSNFDTSSVTDMNGMFSKTRSLTSLNLSNFNTSSVTNMSYMFRGTSALTNVNLSNFDTSAVTRMDFMFHKARALTSLNLSNWKITRVRLSHNMFLQTNPSLTIRCSAPRTKIFSKACTN